MPDRVLKLRTLLVLEHLRMLLTRLKSCSLHDFARYQYFTEECDASLEDVKALAKSWYANLSLSGEPEERPVVPVYHHCECCGGIGGPPHVCVYDLEIHGDGPICHHCDKCEREHTEDI